VIAEWRHRGASIIGALPTLLIFSKEELKQLRG
jgi:hypothetical protein